MSQKLEHRMPKVLPPSAGRLIEGLRDTGYTFNTAVADIVDNSVAADATEIGIRLDQEHRGAITLMIADNGKGMNADELGKAMSYGSPKRSNPASLGKFGLGLKTASTAFCRKLTVVSRKDNILNMYQWDLDVVAREDCWALIEPDHSIYEEHVEFLDEITKGGAGTLIIWEKIDRLIKSDGEGSRKEQIKKRVHDLEEHLSGVFFHFLQKENKYPDINISINGNSIKPWDPFCRWLNETDKTRLEIHTHPVQQYEDESGNVIGQFYLTVYILPNKNQLTKEEIEKARYNLDNQGFHIFREGRMIYSGGWPNRLFVKEPHLNLIRVELQFDHTLDDYFQIDIKKSRVDFPSELRTHLRKIITPARREANQRYRRDGHKKHNTSLETQHDNSSNAIKKHHESVTSGSQVTEVDTTNNEARVKNKFGSTSIKLKIDTSVNRLVQTSESLEDGVLWLPGLADGNKHAVFLNESHEFYKRFYLANKENTALIVAMDAVFWSLAEAELCVMSDSVKRHIEDLRISVSRSLRTLAEELPDIVESENEDDEEDENDERA